jgi:hypothetical protein
MACPASLDHALQPADDAYDFINDKLIWRKKQTYLYKFSGPISIPWSSAKLLVR